MNKIPHAPLQTGYYFDAFLTKNLIEPKKTIVIEKKGVDVFVYARLGKNKWILTDSGGDGEIMKIKDSNKIKKLEAAYNESRIFRP